MPSCRESWCSTNPDRLFCRDSASARWQFPVCLLNESVSVSTRTRSAERTRIARSSFSLLTQGEIRFTPAGYSDGLGLIFRAFMPRRYRVTAVGNVFDLVIAAVVGYGKIGSWADNDICRHFRMYVAEQRHRAHLVEGEGTLFTLGPGSEVVSCFLVGADRSPEDVMLHTVAVQELNRCALLYGHDVRHKHQPFLVHHRVLFGSGKSFPRNGVDVNDRLTFHSSNFALDIARQRPDAQRGHRYHQYERLTLHRVFSFGVWV